MDGVEQAFTQLSPFMGNVPPEMREMILAQINQAIELSVNAARQVDALPRPLPRAHRRDLRVVRRLRLAALRRCRLPASPPPRSALGCATAIWVMLFAKLLGGRAGLVSFFGTTALYAVPFLLTFFNFIPFVGPLLTLIAFIWGLAIYVTATGVSHQFSTGRAIAAVFLPMLLVALLVLLFAGANRRRSSACPTWGISADVERRL